MRLKNREEVLTLIFQGVTERIVIGQEEDDGWKMAYLRANGAVQAEISQGESREQILAVTKHFMEGHGRVLMGNLIASSEIYLGSMNLQPRTSGQEKPTSEVTSELYFRTS